MPHLGHRRPAVVLAALLTPAVALGAAGAAAQTPAVTKLDERAAKRSGGKTGWIAVSSRLAYKRTLLRTRRVGATLEPRVKATSGGSVTFQAGPGRGEFTVTVGTGRGTTRKTFRTVDRRVRLRTMTFRGVGTVRLKVTRPGRKGVYLDAITLTRTPKPSGPTPPVPTPSGSTPPVPTPPAPPPVPPPGTPASAPPASVCPVGTDDGGTLDTTRGTAVRACRLPSRVASNLSLQKLDRVVYSIAGPVEVGSDVGGGGLRAGGNAVTLTVAAGVVFVAGGQSDALVVNRGSRLNAIGTATQPVIFTSRANLTSTLSDTDSGVWAGVTLLGRGPISDCDTAVAGGTASCEQTMPGLTAKYGGDAPNDTSGTLTNVQIRFAGAGTDGAGLRVAGAGQLSAIDHVQVSGSAGDGLAVLGGRPNFASIALTGAADDALFTNFGYRGTIQYLVAAQSGLQNGDSLITADADGNEDALPRQYTRVSNATLVARSAVGGGSAVLLRGGTDFALLNSAVVGPAACLDIDETAGTTTRSADSGLRDLGAPIFRSTVLSCPSAFRDDGNAVAVSNIFASGTNNNSSAHISTLSAFVDGANEAAVTTTNPAGFNNDIFAGANQPNAGAPNRLGAETSIGAIRSAADTRFTGWTCDTSWASFSSGTACVSSPL